MAPLGKVKLPFTTKFWFVLVVEPTSAIKLLFTVMALVAVIAAVGLKLRLLNVNVAPAPETTELPEMIVFAALVAEVNKFNDPFTVRFPAKFKIWIASNAPTATVPFVETEKPPLPMVTVLAVVLFLSLIHISEPTRPY